MQKQQKSGPSEFVNYLVTPFEIFHRVQKQKSQNQK